VASVQAAPAIIWTNGNKQASGVRHTSNDIGSQSVISSALENSSPSLASVVFLVGRDDTGADALTTLASSGALPLVSSKYDVADAIHHHVSGVESSTKLANEANKLNEKVMELSLEEFNRKFASGHVSEDHKDKRSRALAEAKVLIVAASPRQSAELDDAVSKAVENQNFHSVILTAVRSVEEVKHERKLAAQREVETMKAESPRRRLEDAYYQEDLTGIYYVRITPNILAGILFTLFFTSVAYLGITCMGMITGQDVYTDKYPTIGREA